MSICLHICTGHLQKLVKSLAILTLFKIFALNSFVFIWIFTCSELLIHHPVWIFVVELVWPLLLLHLRLTGETEISSIWNVTIVSLVVLLKLVSTSHSISTWHLSISLLWRKVGSLLLFVSKLVLLIAILPLLRLRGDQNLLFTHWVFLLSKFGVAMGVMTFVAKGAVFVSFKVSAPLCLIFVINFLSIPIALLLLHILLKPSLVLTLVVRHHASHVDRLLRAIHVLLHLLSGHGDVNIHRSHSISHGRLLLIIRRVH